MVRFKVVDNEITPVKLGWKDVAKFKSKNTIVTQAGRDYRIFAKKEHKLTKSELTKRKTIGVVVAIFTLGIALSFKTFRRLFTAKRITAKFAIYDNARAYWKTAAPRFGSSNPYLYEISITKNAIIRNPEKFLEYFYKQCFMKSKGCNNIRITLLDDNLKALLTNDFGGVSRDCMTTLFESLRTGNALRFKGNRKDGPIPVGVGLTLTDQEKLYYQAIGKLMGMSLHNGNCPIGQVFDPAIYEVMHAISSIMLVKKFEDLDDNFILRLYRILEMNNSNEYLNLLDTPFIDDDTAQKMFDFTYLELDGSDRPAALQGNPSIDLIHAQIDKVKADLRVLVLESAKADLQAIFQIAKGLNLQNDTTPLELVETIQGVFSKGELKDCLIGDQQLIKFFKKWIDESSDELCKKLLKAATGSKTFTQDKTITINKNGTQDQLPIYHTCNKSMECSSFSSYEVFKIQLENSIADALFDGGFQSI